MVRVRGAGRKSRRKREREVEGQEERKQRENIIHDPSFQYVSFIDF